MSYTKNQDGTPAPSINEQTYRTLVTTRKNHPVTTSRKIAKFFEKNHKDVLRSIKDLGCSEEFWRRNFAPRNYTDGRGKTYPQFEVSKNGFVILAMSFTGEKAMAFKEAYISRFDEMEAKLKEREERAVLMAKDFVRLAGREGDFEALMSAIPFIEDEQGRKCFHYLLSLEKLGFSTRSGSVWKRERRNPSYFVHQDNATYVAEEFIYNMFVGKVKSHNDRVFRSASLQLSLPFASTSLSNQKGGSHA